MVEEELQIHVREDVILAWYKEVFPKAASYIQKKGGDLDMAKEIFQEAIVCYYEKTRDAQFKPEFEDGAYLMGMVKKMWLKHLSKEVKKKNLEGVDCWEEEISNPIKHKLASYLKQAGARCMDLLQAFYYEKMTMKQLAEKFSYRSERSATVQKYKCLEKVRDEVKQKSLSYADFLD